MPAARQRHRRAHAGGPTADDEPAPPRLGRRERPGSEARLAAAAGLTVQLIDNPLKTRPMQPWLPRMQW